MGFAGISMKVIVSCCESIIDKLYRQSINKEYNRVKRLNKYQIVKG